MFDKRTPHQHALDACIVTIAVCAGTTNAGAVKSSSDAIADFLDQIGETKSGEMLALLDLYDRFEEMKLSGRTADAIRTSIQTELEIAFTGKRPRRRVR